MSATMRAAVLHDIKDLRVEDFPKPSTLAPNDVLVHVKYNGLCGTDAQGGGSAAEMAAKGRQIALSRRRIM